MTNLEQITKRAKVIVPDNWDNNQRGIFWENLIADLLRKRGFRVVERIQFTGMEADCIAENTETHQKAWIECKFKTRTTIGADIVNKLIGTAFIKEVTFAYLFSTAEPGKDAKGVIYEENEKNKKQPDRKPRLVFIGPEEIVQLFMDIKGIRHPELTHQNIGLVKNLTLVITPEQMFWVAEEIEAGEARKALLFPTSDKDKININEIIAEFSKLNLWQGLEIIDGTNIHKQTQSNDNSYSVNQEIVSNIGFSDRFEHYQRPCKPEYFVGRDNLIDNFFQVLKDVREDKTSTRILGFSGRSGLGKSSLVLKLQEDCSQNKIAPTNTQQYHQQYLQTL